MNILRKYSSLWLTLTLNSFQTSLTSRASAFLFLIGKLLRFVLFAVFLFALFAKTSRIANYSVLQAVIFYLTYNLVDTTAQLFFREVYRFRQQVVSGDFDLVLVKPSSPLFRALAGGADPLDLFMLIPYVGSLVYAVSRLGSLHITTVGLYILLLMNGFVIATGFHILVLALAVMTTEIDHAIMIYRDITSMARLPVDIYREPLRSLITFVVPVGIMMTFPAKALFGLLTPTALVVSFLIGIAFLLVSVRVWGWSLVRYTSASS